MDVPIKVDVKALEALQERLEDLSAGQKDQFFEAAAKDTVARFLVVVKRATPKDTGTLRRGWTAGKDLDTYSEILAYANSLRVKRYGRSYRTTVENNVEYAEPVELGHRIMRNGRQVGYVPPQYFVKRSQEAFEPHIPKFLEKKLDKFLKEAFDG